MNINLTLIGQAISFAIFVWFCMKYVWPPITSALEKRKKTIADGLAAAEKGQQYLENAKVEIDKLLLGGKDEAKNIINMAEKRADDIVDEANQKAAQESLNKIKIAEQEIEQLANKVKSDLKNDLSALVIEGTQSILKKEVDKKAHDQIIEDLIRRI